MHCSYSGCTESGGEGNIEPLNIRSTCAGGCCGGHRLGLHRLGFARQTSRHTADFVNAGNQCIAGLFAFGLMAGFFWTYAINVNLAMLEMDGIKRQVSFSASLDGSGQVNVNPGASHVR